MNGRNVMFHIRKDICMIPIRIEFIRRYFETDASILARVHK